MSEPNKPGELRDVTVNAISLVSKAANGERFKIFKSAEEERSASEAVKKDSQPAPEAVKKDERGLFRILKEFFTGTDVDVEKGEVSDIYSQNESGRKMYKAFSALMNVLGLSRWDDESLTPETDTTKILAAIDDFRNVAITILIGKSEIEKSGRKISGDRLGKLKNVQAMLNELLNGLEETENSKETEELTKEEVQEIVKEMQKTAEETVNVEKAIETALAPVLERLEKIENARGVSNRVPEDSAVEKGDNDFWGGIF